MVFVARLRLIYWELVVVCRVEGRREGGIRRKKWVDDVEGVEGVETYGCWGGEGDGCGDEEDEDLELHFAWGVG
jgi:hypothetical protein